MSLGEPQQGVFLRHAQFLRFFIGCLYQFMLMFAKIFAIIELLKKARIFLYQL